MRTAERLHKEALAIYFVFKHPRVPWYARLVAVCVAAYLLSPIQLIPSWIPLIGYLDDVLVLFLGGKLVQKMIPADVLRDCRELAEAAELGRKERMRLVAIAALGLLASVIVSVLVVIYRPR